LYFDSGLDFQNRMANKAVGTKSLFVLLFD